MLKCEQTILMTTDNPKSCAFCAACCCILLLFRTIASELANYRSVRVSAKRSERERENEIEKWQQCILIRQKLFGQDKCLLLLFGWCKMVHYTLHATLIIFI